MKFTLQVEQESEIVIPVLGFKLYWWIKAWQIYHEVKTSHGIIASWFWQILSIGQIRQPLATPNFHHLQYKLK